MKYIAIFLLLVVLAVSALGIYAYANARVEVSSITLKAENAATRADDFYILRQQLEMGGMLGTPYGKSMPGESVDYSFFTYTFRLKNKGLIDAEMVEIQPLPVNGDILSYMSLENTQPGVDVVHGQQRDAWCVVLTSAQNQESHAVARTFRITYYIWGIPLSQTVTYQ